MVDNHCKTVRPSKRCVFWMQNKKYEDGKCTFNNGCCLQIIDECEGCVNIEKVGEDLYCKAFMNPSAVWVKTALVDGCSMYTNPEKLKELVDNSKKKLNPLKASKRKVGK